MYIVDGIAYAGQQPKINKVKSVRPVEDYKLIITFSNDEVKMFDFSELLTMPCYQPLKDKELFKSVYVEYGTLVWNDGEIDIAPETLYAKGVTVDTRARA